MSCGKISKKTLNIREFLHLMSFCKEYLTQINFLLRLRNIIAHDVVSSRHELAARHANHSTAYFLPPMIYTPLASPFKAAERTTCLLTRTPETVNTSTRLSAADGFTGMMPVDWTRR